MFFSVALFSLNKHNLTRRDSLLQIIFHEKTRWPAILFHLDLRKSDSVNLAERWWISHLEMIWNNHEQRRHTHTVQWPIHSIGTPLLIYNEFLNQPKSFIIKPASVFTTNKRYWKRKYRRPLICTCYYQFSNPERVQKKLLGQIGWNLAFTTFVGIQITSSRRFLIFRPRAEIWSP